MPIYVGDYYERIDEMKKALVNRSEALLSSIESIDAALWLIAGDRIPQALIMLHNSIEIVFKSELERIHPFLIYEARRLNYDAVKRLLKNSFQTKHLNQEMTIGDFQIQEHFDTEKTITFDEAIKRVSEFYPLVGNWTARLKETKNSRNNITHYGSKSEDIEKYVSQISIILFPFIEKFLGEIEINFEKLVTPPIFREILVSSKVCERLQKANQPTYSYALKTIALQMRHQNVDFPSLSEISGTIDSEQEFLIADRMKSQLEKEWHDFLIEKDCNICDSIYLFVKVELNNQSSLRVVAATCMKCGLDINEKETYLAEYHIGELSNDEINEFLRDIGIDLS